MTENRLYIAIALTILATTAPLIKSANTFTKEESSDYAKGISHLNYVIIEHQKYHAGSQLKKADLEYLADSIFTNKRVKNFFKNQITIVKQSLESVSEWENFLGGMFSVLERNGLSANAAGVIFDVVKPKKPIYLPSEDGLELTTRKTKSSTEASESASEESTPEPAEQSQSSQEPAPSPQAAAPSTVTIDPAWLKQTAAAVGRNFRSINALKSNPAQIKQVEDAAKAGNADAKYIIKKVFNR